MEEAGDAVVPEPAGQLQARRLGKGAWTRVRLLLLPQMLQVGRQE